MKRMLMIAALFGAAGCKLIANSSGDDGTGGDGGSGGEVASTSTTSAGGGEPSCDDCDDGNNCTVDICAPNGCENLGQPTPVDCANQSNGEGLCVWDKCVLQECDPESNGEPCFAAGGIGICKNGACGFCASDAECNDGNPCTLDYCMPGGCYNPEDTMMSACGEGGHCFKAACCEGCIDVKTMSCVQDCPNGAACSSQGTCT